MNPLNPVVTYFDKDPESKEELHVPKTIVRFSVQGSKAPIVLTGNKSGVVDVYRSYGLKHGLVSYEDQINRLQDCLKKDEYLETTDNGGEEAS